MMDIRVYFIDGTDVLFADVKDRHTDQDFDYFQLETEKCLYTIPTRHVKYVVVVNK